MYRAINGCLDTNIQLEVTDVTAVIQKCKKMVLPYSLWIQT